MNITIDRRRLLFATGYSCGSGTCCGALAFAANKPLVIAMFAAQHGYPLVRAHERGF